MPFGVSITVGDRLEFAPLRPNWNRKFLWNSPVSHEKVVISYSQWVHRDLYLRVLTPRAAFNVSETPSIVLATLRLLSPLEAIPLDPPSHALSKKIKQNPMKDLPQISHILQQTLGDW
jgi:hypothetical protein